MSVIVYVVVSGALFYYMNHNALYMNCKKTIKWSVGVLMWLLSAAIYLLCLNKFGMQILGYVYYVISMGMILLGCMDVLELEIPNDMLVGLSVFSFISLFLNPNGIWYMNVAVFVLCMLIVFIITRFKITMLGDGDVFVVGILALALGWQQAFSVLIIGMVLSGIVGGILLISKRVTRKTMMPFVPFLALVQIGLLFI